MKAPPRLAAVVGPTAGGKTALAIALCRRFGAEIVGVDASQIYRGLDIGTGKATASELGGIAHHGIDLADPDTPFDAAAHAASAQRSIDDIRARGRRVVLCGGTGLYLRALVEGLCAAPPVAEPVRAEILAEVAAGRLAELHAALAEADPAAAARIAPADAQRIERALGVFRTTGRPLSDWQAEHRAQPDHHTLVGVAIDWPRDAIWARIERRVDGMLAAGWLDEVERLVSAGHGPALRSMQALGYRHLVAVLAGEMTLSAARERIVIDTRRYARRQRTWFRRTTGVVWVPAPVDVDAVATDLARRMDW